MVFPDYNLSGLSLLRVRPLAFEEQFHLHVTCFEGLLAAVKFASGITCPDGLVKNQGALLNRTGIWSRELLLEGGVHRRGQNGALSPTPMTAAFELAELPPTVFVGSAIASCVCEKPPFFCQAVLTGIWSLNSNCSLIALLSTIHNLPWSPCILWKIQRCKPIILLF